MASAEPRASPEYQTPYLPSESAIEAIGRTEYLRQGGEDYVQLLKLLACSAGTRATRGDGCV